MAVVRDPSFWKRFSMAVHLDEEQTPGLKHTFVLLLPMLWVSMYLYGLRQTNI